MGDFIKKESESLINTGLEIPRDYIKYKGGIFDLDGTLLDSMLVWDRIDEEFLGKRGYKVPEDYLNAIAPLGVLEAAKYTIKRFDFKDTPEELITEWTGMAIYEYSHNIKLKENAKEYLIHLKNNGVKLAIATASSSELFIPALKNNGIYHLFDVFVMVSEVKRGKGFPDIYLEAAKRINLKADQCVVYEDIYEGISGASKGGFFTVGVYDAHSEHRKKDIIEQSDVFVHNLKELISI